MLSSHFSFRPVAATLLLLSTIGIAQAGDFGGLRRLEPPDPRVRTQDGYAANLRSCMDGTGCDRQLLSVTDEGLVRGAEYEGNRRACETGDSGACRPGLLDRDDRARIAGLGSSPGIVPLAAPLPPEFVPPPPARRRVRRISPGAASFAYRRPASARHFYIRRGRPG